MSTDPRRSPVSKAGSRLLICLVLLIGVLSMHGLASSHGAHAGPASASASTPHTSGSPTMAAVAVPERERPAGLEQLGTGAMSVLGGMCLAVLLAAGVLLLRSRDGARRMLRSPGTLLRPVRFDLLPGLDPPGSLLLRLCVMRT